VAQFPELALRRLGAVLEHGFQRIARGLDLRERAANRMPREDRRRRLPQRARLGIDSDGRDPPLGVERHIDLHGRAAHARHFQGRTLRAFKLADMRNIRRQLQNPVVIKIAEHAL
jgi:hypothetical protein